MKIKKLTTISTTVAITTVSSFLLLLTNIQTSVAKSTFVCKLHNGEYMTAIPTRTSYFPLFIWNKWETKDWSFKRRCDEVTNRFNNFTRDDLQDLKVGNINYQPVICANKCTKIVVTFPQNSNPESYLQRLLKIIREAHKASQIPIQLSDNANSALRYGDHGGLVLNVNKLLELVEHLKNDETPEITDGQLHQGLLDEPFLDKL
jgi:Circadian oscillating protein COP23